MIKIGIKSNSYVVDQIIIDIERGDDVVEAIDELYIEHGLPVPTFTYEEVVDEYEFMKDLYESFDDFIDENFIPVNGGEVYINSIVYIIDLSEDQIYDFMEDIRYELVSYINLMDPDSIIAADLMDLVYDLSPEQIRASVHNFNIPDTFIEYRIWVYNVIDNIIEMYGEDESYV